MDCVSFPCVPPFASQPVSAWLTSFTEGLASSSPQSYPSCRVLPIGCAQHIEDKPPVMNSPNEIIAYYRIASEFPLPLPAQVGQDVCGTRPRCTPEGRCYSWRKERAAASARAVGIDPGALVRVHTCGGCFVRACLSGCWQRRPLQVCSVKAVRREEFLQSHHS